MQNAGHLDTLSLPELVDLSIRYFYHAEYDKRIPEDILQLYQVQDYKMESDTVKRFTEYDSEFFAKGMPESAEAQQLNSGIGPSVERRFKRVGGYIACSWFMENFASRYQQIKNDLKNIMPTVQNRALLDATHILTFANATSYVDMDGEVRNLAMADGLSLVNSAHTLAFSATTYSNLITGSPEFSQTALRTAETVGAYNSFNLFGQQASYFYNTIFCGRHPATKDKIKQVLQSTADVDSSNSGVENTKKGAYNLVILDWLATTASGAADTSKQEWWGLAAAGQWQAYFGYKESPNMKAPHMDEMTDDTRIHVRGTYMAAAVSPRGILMSFHT